MAYLPKSKINTKEAQGEDGFVTISSNKSYTGPYIETSDGKYFAGNSTINRGEELILPQSTSPNFGKGKDFKTYLDIRPSPYKFLNKTKPIPSSKNIPTEKDYERGYYNRYFSSRVNQQFGYKEIDYKIYKSINSEEGKYDHHLHDVGLIKWAIKGNVYKINQLQLKRLERTFTYISHLFPILNEFHRPDLQVQTHLNTEGDELYYINGSEYRGSYHIHPKHGPMEGAIHTTSTHSKLYYSDQIPPPINESSALDEDFKKYLNKVRKDRLLSNKTHLTQETLRSTGDSRGGNKSENKSTTGGTSGEGTSGTSGGGRGGY